MTYTELDAELDRLQSTDKLTPAHDRKIAAVLWDMVQLDMAAGEDYGEWDLANYQAAANGLPMPY